MTLKAESGYFAFDITSYLLNQCEKSYHKLGTTPIWSTNKNVLLIKQIFYGCDENGHENLLSK